MVVIGGIVIEDKAWQLENGPFPKFPNDTSVAIRKHDVTLWLKKRIILQSQQIGNESLEWEIEVR